MLSEKGYVAPVDLLQRLGWLKPEDYENWRFRRVPYLERVVTGSLARLSFAMHEFRRWARGQGLRPSWTNYRSWGCPHRITLRFSRSGEPAIEQAYATHWLPPKASGRADTRREEPET